VGNIVRKLRTKIHAHTFGPNQAHDLFDTLQQRRGSVIKKQMRFIEKEHQLRLVEVTYFGQALEQFRQEPQQETGIQPRFQDELIGSENTNDAAAAEIGTHQIAQIEGRLAKQFRAAFPFN